MPSSVAAPTVAEDAPEAWVDASLEAIARVCRQHPGTVPARLRLEMPAGYSVLVNSGEDLRVTPTEGLVAAIERVMGVQAVARN